MAKNIQKCTKISCISVFLRKIWGLTYIEVKNLCRADSENFSQRKIKLIELLDLFVTVAGAKTEIWPILCIFWVFGHKMHTIRDFKLTFANNIKFDGTYWSTWKILIFGQVIYHKRLYWTEIFHRSSGVYYLSIGNEKLNLPCTYFPSLFFGPVMVRAMCLTATPAPRSCGTSEFDQIVGPLGGAFESAVISKMCLQLFEA